MPLRKLLPIALLLSSIAAPIASAAGFADVKLPKGFGLVMSIRATQKTVQAIDAFATSCTKGTDKQLPDGMVAAMINYSYPFLRDLDAEAHLYLPAPASYAALFNHVILVGNMSIDQVAEVLDRFGISMTRAGSGTYYTFQGNKPKRVPYYCHDIGNGYIAFSPNPNMLGMIAREIERGWRPTPWTGGLISFLVERPGEWMVAAGGFNLLPGLAAMFLADEGAKKLEGVNVPALLRLLDTMNEAFVDIGGEFATIQRIGYECGIDRDGISASFRLLADRDSFLGRAGAAMAAARPLEDGAFRHAAAGVSQAVAVADLEKVVPGFNDVLGEAVSRLGTMVFPDAADLLTAAYQKHCAGGSGEMLMVSDFIDNFPSASAYLWADSPKDTVESRLQMVKAAASIIRTVLPDLVGDSPLVAFEDGKTAADIPYTRIRWDANQQFLRRGFEQLGQDAEKAFSTVMVAGDGVAVVLSGNPDERRLDEAFKGGEKAAHPLVNTPASREILGKLEARQGVLGLVSADRLLWNFVVLHARIEGRRQGAEPEEIEHWITELEKNVELSDSLIGFGWGGKNDCLVGNVVVPAGTVNALVRTITKMDAHMPFKRQSTTAAASDRPNPGE